MFKLPENWTPEKEQEEKEIDIIAEQEQYEEDIDQDLINLAFLIDVGLLK